MDTTLYQRDRGELDWDARSMASTAMFDDSASISQKKAGLYASPRPAAFDRYMSHGPSVSNGSDIELARLDSNDQLPLLNRPGGMARGISDMSVPSRPGSRLAGEVDLGVPGGRATPTQMYRQDGQSERSLPPSYSGHQQAQGMSRQGSPYGGSDNGASGNMAGRGAFRNQQQW